jgi:hypothetical protein
LTVSRRQAKKTARKRSIVFRQRQSTRKQHHRVRVIQRPRSRELFSSRQARSKVICTHYGSKIFGNFELHCNSFFYQSLQVFVDRLRTVCRADLSNFLVTRTKSKLNCVRICKSDVIVSFLIRTVLLCVCSWRCFWIAQRFR